MEFESKFVLESQRRTRVTAQALSWHCHWMRIMWERARTAQRRPPPGPVAHGSGRGAGTPSGTTARQRSVESSVSRSFLRPKLFRTAFACVAVTGGARLSQLLRT